MISSLYFAVNVRRRARSGTSGSGRSVPPPPLIRPGSSIPVARTNVVTLLVISGKLSIPALGSLIVRGQVPQPRLAERGPAVAIIGSVRRLEFRNGRCTYRVVGQIGLNMVRSMDGTAPKGER